MDIEEAVSRFVDAIDAFKHARRTAENTSDEDLNVYYDAQHAAERAALSVARTSRDMTRALADY